MTMSFLKSLLLLFPKALIARGPTFFLRSLREKALVNLEERRLWLAGLGISWLAGLGICLALLLWGYFSSTTGLWSFLWQPARSIEPPMWIFILGDARVQGLLFCALLGFLPAFVTGWGGWAWVLAPVALYPGILSLAGAWTLILADRLGLWLRLMWAEKNKDLRMDIGLRALVALIVGVWVIFFGAALRDWVQFNFGGENFIPETRFIGALFGLILITAFETVFAMVVLHFRFVFISKSATLIRSRV